MEPHTDRVKFLMSEERKHQHDPVTILKEAGATKGMTIADLGSGPGFFTIPMAQMVKKASFTPLIATRQC